MACDAKLFSICIHTLRKRVSLNIRFIVRISRYDIVWWSPCPRYHLKITTVASLIISLCTFSQKIGPIALAVQAVRGGASDLGVSTSYISSPSVSGVPRFFF